MIKGNKKNSKQDHKTSIAKELKRTNFLLEKLVLSIEKLTERTGSNGFNMLQSMDIVASLKKIAYPDGGGTYELTPNTPTDKLTDLQIEREGLEIENIENERRKLLKGMVPKYDSQTKVLTVENINIRLVPDTKEAIVCDVLFNNTADLYRDWSWDEVIEAMGDTPEENKHKVVYRAGNRLNNKVGKETSVKELFIVSTKTIKLNPNIYE